MPRVFFRPDLALALDPAILASLFASFGAPAPWKKRGARDPRTVARWLWGGDAPDALADRLAWIARYADARAKDALVDAEADARRQGHFASGAIDRALAAAGAPANQWREMAAVDLAARLALAFAREPLLRVVVERAEHALARLLPACIPFQLATARARSRDIDRPTPVDPSISGALTVAAREESTWAETWCAEDDGALVCAVLRASPRDAVIDVDVDGRISRSLGHALVTDVVRLDACAARLSIATSRPSLVPAYARAIGARAHGDPTAFLGRAALTLKKLQSLGSAGIARLRFPSPIASVEVVALELYDGRGARKKAHGRDALRSLEAEMRRGGYLTSATLRFVLDDARVVDAYIDLPNRLSLSDDRFERVARAGLGALGVFEPGAIADDVVTLAPWVHPEWRWRDVLGDDGFARAGKRKLLVRVAVKQSGARVASKEDARLGARVRGWLLTSAADAGKHYAVAEDPSVRPRTVAVSALAMYELRPARVSVRIRDALGLRAPSAAEKIVLPKGVVDVGLLDLLGAAGLRFVRLVRAVGDDEANALAAKIRRACGGKQHAVVLVPEGRALGKVLPEITLGVAQQLGVGAYEGVVLAAARELRVDDALPARHVGTRERPLVLSVAREEAHLGGVLLGITDGQQRMLVGLARADERIVHVKELGQITAPGVAHVDKAVRKTRGDLDARIAASFARAGEELPEAWRELVVQVGRKGYRLAVGAIVR